MRAAEAVIAWTPASFEDETAGQVQINRMFLGGSSEWSRPYRYTGGAAFVERRLLSEDESITAVFIDFNTLVVRDGTDPQVAHREFLKIEEYADYVSADIGMLQ